MAKINIRKAKGREFYSLKISEKQKVEFIDPEGYILGSIEIRDGELYLIKTPHLKGHDTGSSENFGTGVRKWNEVV